jgi:hypothetical protein
VQAVRQAHAREPEAQALHPPRPQGDVQALSPGRPLEGGLQRSNRTQGAEARQLVLRATPTDAAGNTGKPDSLSIRIVR